MWSNESSHMVHSKKNKAFRGFANVVVSSQNRNGEDSMLSTEQDRVPRYQPNQTFDAVNQGINSVKQLVLEANISKPSIG